MMRLSIAAVALAAFGLASPASAFHPFDDTYGYVMPDRLKRHQKVEKTEPAPLFGFKQKSVSKTKKKNDEDQNAAPQKKVAKKGPAELDGGGTPNIAAVAPPKVSFPNSYGSSSIVIDTAGRHLYYVLSSSSAYRYPIAVGREGFAWTGTEQISKKVAWPAWKASSTLRAN